MINSKMTKNDLKQIMYLNSEVKMWQEELERCQYDLGVQSPGWEDRGKSGGNSDKTANLAIKIADIKSIIEKKLIEIQIERKRIITYINSIEDSLMRQIFFFRYVSGLSWTTLSMQIGGYNTPDNLRVMHENYLKSKYTV